MRWLTGHHKGMMALEAADTYTGSGSGVPSPGVRPGTVTVVRSTRGQTGPAVPVRVDVQPFEPIGPITFAPYTPSYVAPTLQEQIAEQKRIYQQRTGRSYDEDVAAARRAKQDAELAEQKRMYRERTGSEYDVDVAEVRREAEAQRRASQQPVAPRPAPIQVSDSVLAVFSQIMALPPREQREALNAFVDRNGVFWMRYNGVLMGTEFALRDAVPASEVNSVMNNLYAVYIVYGKEAAEQKARQILTMYAIANAPRLFLWASGNIYNSAKRALAERIESNAPKIAAQLAESKFNEEFKTFIDAPLNSGSEARTFADRFKLAMIGRKPVKAPGNIKEALESQYGSAISQLVGEASSTSTVSGGGMNEDERNAMNLNAARQLQATLSSMREDTKKLAAQMAAQMVTPRALPRADVQDRVAEQELARAVERAPAVAVATPIPEDRPALQHEEAVARELEPSAAQSQGQSVVAAKDIQKAIEDLRREATSEGLDTEYYSRDPRNIAFKLGISVDQLQQAMGAPAQVSSPKVKAPKQPKAPKEKKQREPSTEEKLRALERLSKAAEAQRQVPMQEQVVAAELRPQSEQYVASEAHPSAGVVTEDETERALYAAYQIAKTLKPGETGKGVYWESIRHGAPLLPGMVSQPPQLFWEEPR